MPVDSRPCATHGRAPLHRVEARDSQREARDLGYGALGLPDVAV